MRRAISLEQVPVGQLPLALVSNDGSLCWNHEEVGGPAVVAHVNGVVVGLLAYAMSRHRCLEICVVWVAPPLRRAGVAKQLFHVARAERPKSVRAAVISREGLQYLLWVRENFKGRVSISRRHLLPLEIFGGNR